MPLDSHLPGAHAWLLLAFGAFILAVLVWSIASSHRERLTQEVVRCPLKRKSARIFVRRTAGGRFVGIQSCSALSPPTPITCRRGCRSQIRAT